MDIVNDDIVNDTISKITIKEEIKRGLPPINKEYHALYRIENADGKVGGLINISLMDLMGIKIELVKDKASGNYFFVTPKGNVIWRVFHLDVKRAKLKKEIRSMWVSNINYVDVELSPVTVNNYMFLLEKMGPNCSIDEDTSVYFAIFSDLLKQIIKSDIRGAEYSHSELLDMVNTIRLYGLTINSDINWYGVCKETHQEIGPKYLLLTDKDSINTTLICGMLEPSSLVPILKYGRQGYQALLPKMVRLLMGNIDYNVTSQTLKNGDNIVMDKKRYINSLSMANDIGLSHKALINFAKQFILDNPMLLNEMFITPYKVDDKMFASFDMSKKLYLRIMNNIDLEGDGKEIANHIIHKAFDIYADYTHNTLNQSEGAVSINVLNNITNCSNIIMSVSEKITKKAFTIYKNSDSSAEAMADCYNNAVNNTVKTISGFNIKDDQLLFKLGNANIDNQISICMVVLKKLDSLLDTDISMDDFSIYLDMLENLK